jgi:hypothetical protein
MIVEKLNNGTESPTKDEAIQYMTKTIHRTFLNINVLLKIKDIMNPS